MRKKTKEYKNKFVYTKIVLIEKIPFIIELTHEDEFAYIFIDNNKKSHSCRWWYNGYSGVQFLVRHSSFEDFLELSGMENNIITNFYTIVFDQLNEKNLYLNNSNTGAVILKKHCKIINKSL